MKRVFLLLIAIVLLLTSGALLWWFKYYQPEVISPPIIFNEVPDTTKIEISKPIMCSSCNYIIPTSKGLVDGNKIEFIPGDTLCLDGQLDTYHHITFRDLNGTEENPIVITNCNNSVSINTDYNYGIKFIGCTNIIFAGSRESKDNYGIKISTSKGFFLSIEQFSTNFEVANIEIAGYEPNGIGERKGFAGIGVKTSPYQDCQTFSDSTRKSWIMKNIIIRDCYIHDVGGEGIYMGHGFYNGRIEKKCGFKTWSHSIHDSRIFNNRIENVGYDGIQIKNADHNFELYNNLIINFGTRNKNSQNEGLFIGEGTTGKFYNNIVINGTGHGIQFYGMGNNDIFNNIVVNAGTAGKGDGFYGSGGDHSYKIADSYVNIFNNTFVGFGRNAFAFYEGGSVNRMYNNIFVANTNIKPLGRKGVEIDSSNNIVSRNVASIGFKNYKNGDFSLDPNSRIYRQGVDLEKYGLTKDIYGNARSKYGKLNIGAIE